MNKKLIFALLSLVLVFSFCACGSISTEQAAAYSDDVQVRAVEVPEGKPEPIDSESQKIDKSQTGTCTLTVSCETILDNMEKLNEEKRDLIPDDGVILATREVTFYDGETVFDVLKRELMKEKIHFEFENTPLYDANYISGIANIYEFDCGSLSGWNYKVNDWIPNYGCSRYLVSEGDDIRWLYTCDLGEDLR